MLPGLTLLRKTKLTVPSQIEWRERIRKMRSEGVILTHVPVQQLMPAVRPIPNTRPFVPTPGLAPIKLAPPPQQAEVIKPREQLLPPNVQETSVAPIQAYVEAQAKAIPPAPIPAPTVTPAKVRAKRTI